MTYMQKLSGPTKLVCALLLLFGVAHGQTGLSNYPANSLAGSPGNVTGPVMGNGASPSSAATAHQLNAPLTCTTTNSSNAYSCSTSPTFTPAANDRVQVTFNAANTGSATLAVNGATATTIYKYGGSSALVANDLLAGHIISAVYTGSQWQLEGQLGNPTLVLVAAGTVTLATGSIASGAQALPSTTTVTTTYGTAANILYTDLLGWNFQNSSGTIFGTLGYEPATTGMLTVACLPSSSTPYVNCSVANNTSAAITPGAITITWYDQRHP
jgi:hypothetical protein